MRCAIGGVWCGTGAGCTGAVRQGWPAAGPGQPRQFRAAAGLAAPAGSTARSGPTHYRNAEILARVSENLGEPMVGIGVHTLAPEQQLAVRGW